MTDMHRQCGKEAVLATQSERGDRWKPLGYGPRRAGSKPPGRTGTGAPVTEQLRYHGLNVVIRVVPRSNTSPLNLGARFIFFCAAACPVNDELWR